MADREKKTKFPEQLVRQKYPLDKIRKGYYSDKYFVRTREILVKDGYNPRVVMQVFAKKRGFFCGAREAALVLREGSVGKKSIDIRALPEGVWFRPWETVMTIEGPYQSFAHLETVYLGIIARRTAVATAVRKAVAAAQGKPIFFFSARFDHPCNQEGDGYAAMSGGAEAVSTDANGAWIGQPGIGTIPHALIAAYGGNTVKASVAFDRHIAKDVGRIALVDFTNNCPAVSLAVARALKRRLWGVRLDTAETLIDMSLQQKGIMKRGVCPELVWEVRRALDSEGFQYVKIVVSGGFSEYKIRKFMKDGVPCDYFGVGAHFFQRRIDFTADIVMVNDTPMAKAGRCGKPNPRLIQY